MNNYILELASVDYLSLLLAAGTIVVGSVFIKEAFTKFCTSFGIEFAFIKAANERKAYEKKVKEDLESLTKRQEELENLHNHDMKKTVEFNDKIINCINSLKDDFKALSDDIDRREAEKRFKKLRFDILSFADRIVHAQSVTSELIEQIFEECGEYEDLITEYNFKNDRVNASMAVIRKKYEELLMEGKIIKGDD